MTSSNAVQAQRKPKFSVAITTKGYQKLINNTLGDKDRASRFVASITSAVGATPALQDCDAGTILAGALLGESLGLSPSPQLGQYYLVPFECRVKGPDGKVLWVLDENGNHIKDSNGHWIAQTEKKASFVLGYKGYIQLALRSGSYSDLDCIEIKDGEYLGRDSSNGKPKFSFVEDDDERDALPVIGYMAYLQYQNGFQKTIYWSKEKMMRHADKYSQAFSAKSYEKLQNGEIPDNEKWKYSSHWYTDFDAMAKKTMIRQLISKWGIVTADMQKAIDSDTENPVSDVITVSENNHTPVIDAAPPQPIPEAPRAASSESEPVESVNFADL